jgi:nucleotide-binding universal stress UspA family protein
MFRSILVGVYPEHDDEADACIRMALRLLEEGGNLVLVSVIDRPEGPTFFPALEDEEEVKSAVQHLERALTVLVRKQVPLGIDVDSIVRVGQPGKRLVAESGERQSDLVIVFEHEHLWPLSRDTVNYVLSHAGCPVLVLPQSTHV